MRLFYSVTMLLSLAASGCSGCGEGYSTGTRVGVITKFSRKGLLCKSWVGEAALVGFKGTETGLVANTWLFHADERVVAQVESAMNTGKPVAIKYRQWSMPPWCQGSDYDVVAVEPLDARADEAPR